MKFFGDDDIEAVLCCDSAILQVGKETCDIGQNKMRTVKRISQGLGDQTFRAHFDDGSFQDYMWCQRVKWRKQDKQGDFNEQETTTA